MQTNKHRKMLQNQELVFTLNREVLRAIIEDMQKIILVAEKNFTIRVEKTL